MPNNQAPVAPPERAHLPQNGQKTRGFLHFELLIGDANADVVQCEVEEAHAAQLTRDEVTATVHYVRFKLTPEQVERFVADPVVVAVNHPAYTEGAHLTDGAKRSLEHDLRGI